MDPSRIPIPAHLKKRVEDAKARQAKLASEDRLLQSISDALREEKAIPLGQCEGQLTLPLGYYDHGDPDDITI